MRLVNVSVENYRSIKNGELNGCGPFNVLIGKNNSGKSTALAAINLFFQAMENGDIVNSDVSGRSRDFSKRKLDHSVVIACELLLSEQDRADLVQNMRDERPQLETALGTIPDPALLRVEVEINAPPKSFSTVRRLTLSNPQGSVTKPVVLLEVKKDASQCLFDAANTVKEADAATAFCNNFLNSYEKNDWTAMKQRDSRLIGSPIVSFIRRNSSRVDGAVVKAVQNAIESAASFDDVQSQIRDLVETQAQRKSETLGQQLAVAIRTFAGEERLIPRYIRTLLGAVASMKVLYLTEYRKQIGAEEAQKLLELKTRRGGTETLQKVQLAVGDLLGVQIDAFSSDEPASERSGPTAELDVDNFLVEMNGSGIREALRLVLDTAFGKPDLLLVEEPEIHLHPALEASMMRFLQNASQDCQVFITTHSTNFLDRASFQNVYLVSKDESTVITRLAYEEAERRIPEELGIRLSSLFMYDRLVFVEGPSDELVCREIGNTLQVNFNKASVGFIHLHGIGNLAHYAAKEVIDFLSSRRVKLFFLVDRDEKAQKDIERIKERLGAAVTFLPTTARELENYLLHPYAITTYLNAKLMSIGRTDLVPTEADVQKHLDAAAEQLRRLTEIRRICAGFRPIYPPRYDYSELPASETPIEILKTKMEKMIELVRLDACELVARAEKVLGEIDERWKTDRFNLCPGSSLLEIVFAQYALKFDKTRDAPGLAACMRDKDVDRNLVRFIEAIGAL